MQTITLTAEIGNDGILHLTLPTQCAGQRCEVLIVLQPTLATPTDARGWPVGFFEQTAGSLPDFPDSDFSGLDVTCDEEGEALCFDSDQV